ncbi:hypothetical protein K7X08_035531 [Anisodus acutangulus]|uniref:Uncharacterized protein n=1 Tax=Anisodus acutangulus TaxID=402998 RepID=A0A9Q1LIZ4_9SOLA|nr:hypothetical protein K7X08_035531 [Anisodus acutangulus]
MTIQGSSNITTYFTRLRSLSDELSTAYVGPTCSCGALPKLLEEQKLFQFLDGLSDSYSTWKSKILVMSPLPSLSRAYSLLQHDEKQNEHSPSASHLSHDSMSFHASGNRYFGASSSTGSSGYSGGSENYNTLSSSGSSNNFNASPGSSSYSNGNRSTYASKSSGSSTGNTNFNVSSSFNSFGGARNYSQMVNFDTNRPSSNLFFKLCKNPWHAVDRCYKLHRFPSNFKFTNNRDKNRKSVVCVQADPSTSSSFTSMRNEEAPTHCFSREQYHHLMSLLQQTHISPDYHSESTNAESIGFANFVAQPVN